MKCPFCGNENTKVVDSRAAEVVNLFPHTSQILGQRRTIMLFEDVESVKYVERDLLHMRRLNLFLLW